MQRGVAGGAVAVLLCLLCAPGSARTLKITDEVKRQNDNGVVAELVPGITDGYEWVPWGPRAFCSPGNYAVAFQLKVEPLMLLGDFTALNAVKLYCFDRATGRLDLRITSTVGRWGLWGTLFVCTAGYLTGARLRVEQPWEAKGDKSATNNLAMECENGERMTGDGSYRGQWGEWQQCPQGSAICGLATQVERTLQLYEDEVSLVSVAFYCCTM